MWLSAYCGFVVVDEVWVSRSRRLAEERLAVLPRRLAHTRGVALAAARLSMLVEAGERAAVVAAGWLHDVGYSPDLAVTGFHPLDGARFVRAQGYPELIVRLVAHHTGADVEARLRGLSDELAVFARPPDSLLDVVTCADLITSPDGAVVEPKDRVDEMLTRYHPGDVVFAAVTESRPALLDAAARVSARSRDAAS